MPFEYVIQCKEVCKTWRNLLRHIKRRKKVNLLFVGKHGSDGMQLYHGEYDEKSNKELDEQLSYNALTPLSCPYINYNSDSFMVSSHRGLVCFHETNNNVNDPIYICNPFTRETVRIPQLGLSKRAQNDLSMSGFGYLYASNEYKIVRIYYKIDSRFCVGQVYVYTLGDKRGWRNKGLTSNYLRKSQGILSDGALHWIAETGLEIVAFDLADEKLRSIPVPPLLQRKDNNAYPHQLLRLGGYLSVVLQHGSSTTDIWLLKETNDESGYTVKEHWSTEFAIHSKNFYHQFALMTEENKILMWLDRSILCRYDPKTATVEEKSADVRFQKLQVIPYMKSGVSLEALLPDLPLVDVENWPNVKNRKAMIMRLVNGKLTQVNVEDSPTLYERVQILRL